MASVNIDSLLERYLGLLDEYTRLRSELNKVQGEMYQSLARANFSAPRGVRYGPDLYDQRMQASKTLKLMDDMITGLAVFTVSESSHDDTDAAESSERSKSQDPIRWFGLFAPAALRQTQVLSTQLVDDVVPRLASLDAEMADVELQIRRARKQRAKLEKLKTTAKPAMEVGT